MPSSIDRRSGDIAYVSEDGDLNHLGWLTGRFSVHVESAVSEQAPGPESVSVEEAIAWGREHAPRVHVLLGSGPAGALGQTRYTAGVEPIEEQGVLPWPTDGLTVRARPQGTRADGLDQVLIWSVMIVVGVEGLGPTDVADAERLLAAQDGPRLVRVDLASDSMTVRFQIHDGPGDPDVNNVTSPVTKSLVDRFGPHIRDISVLVGDPRDAVIINQPVIGGF